MDPADVRKLLTHNEEAAPFVNAYSTYMYVMFVLSSLLTFVSLYLFLGRQIRLHSELRSIVTHTTLSSYAMTSTMCLWQVVVLPPYVGGYPIGIIFKTIGPYSFLLGLWICWSCVIHLGVTYTVGFSLQCFRMKISGQKNCLGEVFEWFIMGNNATTFLRFFAFFNFSFVLVPIASLYWFTVPFEKEPQLQELSKQHPSMILILIRENVVFLACVLLCATLISAEIAYCLKTNWSTFKTIRKTSGIVTQKTFRMQIHMYRLFSLQLFMIFIFYYLPTLVACLHMWEIIDLKNFATLNITFMLWHCPVQNVIALLGYPGIRKKITSLATGTSKLSKLSKNSLTSRSLKYSI